MNRLRRCLLLAAALAPAAVRARDEIDYPPVTPRALQFPRDFGAHAPFRIEWWYLTGVLDAAPQMRQSRLGIQLTFFRIRPPIDPGNPSRFAAHQVVMAHAAIADPTRGSLLHEERIERTGFGIASMSELDTDVRVDGWSLARDAASGIYHGRARGERFELDVLATPAQPPLLQGNSGYSRKGPKPLDNGEGPAPASFYYSQPQLALQAKLWIAQDGDAARTEDRGAGNSALREGLGWLDHEWSSALLPPQAAGWDWAGFNLDDGSALTVFRIRRSGAAAADPPYFAYASLRTPGGPTQTFAPAQIAFAQRELWTSPRTRAIYPVAQRIQIGSRRFETRPLMQDQELDSRATTGFAYWEGASDLLENGRTIGRGYLELTGYAGAVPG